MKIDQLHQAFLKCGSVGTDTRTLKKGALFFALKGDNFNGNHYALEALEKGASLAVVDEPQEKDDARFVLMDNALESLQQLAHYHRHHCKARILALTGSNGKTTTKELIHRVLSKKYNTIATKGNLNNHIGVALTLLEITAETELAVIEMGANHQREIAFLCSIAEPDFGYITNYGKAHLEGFGGVQGVIKGKSEMYDHLMAHGKKIFFNADDPIQAEKLRNYVEKYGFSQENHLHFKIQLLRTEPFLTLSAEGTEMNTQLIGAYNFPNCCAAVIMGKYFNVPMPDIALALESYVPENNRSQLLTKNGKSIVLDAYNANPSSMQVALEHFAKGPLDKKVVFLGDMFEMGDYAKEEHTHITNLAKSLGFGQVYLVGSHFKEVETDYLQFATFGELEVFLKANPLPKDAQILIKGSRGMALERILELL
ncbi:UDP-N-acetylmuramoyl-tripeptide--D-alanyl-D-alanine ligase [Maribacter sp. 2307ULW6-5]|uniref:UDP-N-acetylmuramoyl-tripeptide--D-alanyl-D- alanine ligase n=1 Tax=Maribacter sp. 2307ULW6-5 TaxID=3386275 RepID=UPI0039BC7792